MEYLLIGTETFTGVPATLIGMLAAVIILFGMPRFMKFFKATSVQNNEEENIEDIILEDFGDSESLEIIAAITAALAASLNKSEEQFIIRSIKRTNSWNETAKYERQLRNR